MEMFCLIKLKSLDHTLPSKITYKQEQKQKYIPGLFLLFQFYIKTKQAVGVVDE